MSDPAAPGARPDTPGALPVGTRLGEFELRDVIGVGGFGIVYLAFDHALECEVAIKEYMPAALAARGGSAQVAPLSQSVSENFETGLRSFVDEGRMLARFDSPSLLKAYRYWEANGTAYIAMPLYRGRTLKEHRAAMAAPPDEAAARALLMPLLQAVDLLHRESIYHRDIAPDNILIEAGNRPVLLDIGVERCVVGEKIQALTAIPKSAYAPIEQYGEAASVKQGPWTDLYALGATMHYLLLGQAPPPAKARAVADDMQPLAERELPGCSKRFLRAIDWMLAPRPADRPQSVAALVDVLEGRADVPARGDVADKPPDSASRGAAADAAATQAAMQNRRVGLPVEVMMPISDRELEHIRRKQREFLDAILVRKWTTPRRELGARDALEAGRSVGLKPILVCEFLHYWVGNGDLAPAWAAIATQIQTSLGPNRFDQIEDAPSVGPQPVTSRSERPLVFLCHASEDKSQVRKYAALLNDNGFHPWLDEDQLLPGQRWEKEIPKAIEQASAVIIFLSSRSQKRGYVQKEIVRVLDEAEHQPDGTIFLIPAKLEACEVPSRLSPWQWVDLTLPNGFERLCKALETHRTT